jgi:hypothetical protein
MKYFKWVLYAILIYAGLLLVFSYIPDETESDGSSVTATQGSDFEYRSPEQVGYFKADNNNRVFTFNIDSRMPEAEIRSHADSRMHTSGRITYVFYYYGDASNPTTASSLDRALQITENTNFRYSFMKMGNGQSNFSSHR